MKVAIKRKVLCYYLEPQQKRVIQRLDGNLVNIPVLLTHFEFSKLVFGVDLLTLNSKDDAFTNWGRYSIACNTQIFANVCSRRGRKNQRISVHCGHSSTVVTYQISIFSFPHDAWTRRSFWMKKKHFLQKRPFYGKEATSYPWHHRRGLQDFLLSLQCLQK